MYIRQNIQKRDHAQHRSAGIRVPEDIQVVGFDDTSSSVFSRPTLSTVWQQPKVLADAVFSMMKAFLDGEDYPHHISLSQSVVLRESTTIHPESLEKAGVIYRQDSTEKVQPQIKIRSNQTNPAS